MELPGAQQTQNEDILQLIEQITADNDKLIRFTIEGSIAKTVEVDARYAFESQGEDIYALHIPTSFRQTVYRSKQALHDSMLDGLEAEILDIGELEDEKRKRWHNRITAKQDPITHVYVFVKTTEDGRYKDEWKYFEGQSEQEIRESEDLPVPGDDSKFVYHCLGNIKELRENVDDYSFDLKPFSGRVPSALPWMTEKGEMEELMEQIRNNSSNSGGNSE